jgi:hypothetical protein
LSYRSEVVSVAAGVLDALSERLDGWEDRFDDFLRARIGRDWGELDVTFWRWPILAAENRDLRDAVASAEAAYERLAARYEEETGKRAPAPVAREWRVRLERLRRTLAFLRRERGL